MYISILVTNGIVGYLESSNKYNCSSFINEFDIVRNEIYITP